MFSLSLYYIYIIIIYIYIKKDFGKYNKKKQNFNNYDLKSSKVYPN